MPRFFFSVNRNVNGDFVPSGHIKIWLYEKYCSDIETKHDQKVDGSFWLAYPKRIIEIPFQWIIRDHAPLSRVVKRRNKPLRVIQ